MKLFNNAVSAFVIAVIALLIVPLPTWLLDFMFIANLTISFVILLTTMYIRESLEFSIYPSMLLITTLFRLALNVSSTPVSYTHLDVYKRQVHNMVTDPS